MVGATSFWSIEIFVSRGISQRLLYGPTRATMASQPTPNIDASRNPETLYVFDGELFNPRGEGFALRKGDPVALNFFDNWIVRQWRSGWLEETHDHLFAGEEWSAEVARWGFQPARHLPIEPIFWTRLSGSSGSCTGRTTRYWRWSRCSQVAYATPSRGT